MARIITIAGTDRTTHVKLEEFSIEQILTSREDNCSFVLTAGSKPTAGQEIIVTDGGVKFFAGIIDVVQDDPRAPGIIFYKCQARDYTYQLDKKLVVETYSNQAADVIVKDILTKYCAGFTSTNIKTGAPTVEEIVFDYRRPSECFKDLAEFVGWDWYVDYDKDVWFFNPSSLATPAPVSIASNTDCRNLKHDIETEGLRNRIFVRGGTMLSDNWTYEVKADGAVRTWLLPHKPHNISLTVGGVAKTIGIENIDDEATKDYLMNYQEKYVRASAQTATPAAGTTMAFTYKYDIDVITMVEDVASQNAVKAVQGGDGVYEHSIVDDSLATIDTAEAAGNADLREHANPRVKGSFETEISGWAPGQLITINLPNRGITGTFLAQKVTLTPITANLWTYRVEYGGRLLGIADWLQALWKAQQKKKLNETTLLHKFHYGAETAKVTDEVQGTPRTPPWKVEESLEIDFTSPTAPVSSFARASVKYKKNGTEVASGSPTYEAGKFNNGVHMEETTTNLVKNAGFEVDAAAPAGVADGWSSYADAALTTAFSMDTTNKRPSGSQAQKIAVTASTAAGVAEVSQVISGLSAGVTYTLTVYFKELAKAGTAYSRIVVNWKDAAGAALGAVASTASLGIDANGFGRYVITATSPASTTQATINLQARSAASGDTITIVLDDVQFEAKGYATSAIIAADTTTQPSRAADSLYYTPAYALPAEWFISGFWKPDHASTVNIGHIRCLEITFYDENNRHMIFYDHSDGKLKHYKVYGGTAVVLASVALTFSAGDIISFAAAQLTQAYGDLAAGMHLWYKIAGGSVVHISNTDVNLPTAATKVYCGCAHVDGYEANGVIDAVHLIGVVKEAAEGTTVNNAWAESFLTAGSAPVLKDTSSFLLTNLDDSLTAQTSPATLIDTIGGYLNVWQPGSLSWAQPQYKTSNDGGVTWSGWQDINPVGGAVDVPQPGKVKLKANSRIQAKNWKKPFDQTDIVCGFVMCSS